MVHVAAHEHVVLLFAIDFHLMVGEEHPAFAVPIVISQQLSLVDLCKVVALHFIALGQLHLLCQLQVLLVLPVIVDLVIVDSVDLLEIEIQFLTKLLKGNVLREVSKQDELPLLQEVNYSLNAEFILDGSLLEEGVNLSWGLVLKAVDEFEDAEPALLTNNDTKLLRNLQSLLQKAVEGTN